MVPGRHLIIMMRDELTCMRLKLVRRCRREGRERKKHQRWSRWQDPSFDDNGYFDHAFHDGHAIYYLTMHYGNILEYGSLCSEVQYQ